MRATLQKAVALLLALLLLCGCSEKTTEKLGELAVDAAIVVLDELASQAQQPASSASRAPKAASESSKAPAAKASSSKAPLAKAGALDESGSYTEKEDVALYLHSYGRLPANFITKTAARKLGWESGSLEPYAPGRCIGGDPFGNYEGLLPKAKGRSYRECDIGTLGKKSRGEKRIVYSNDGLIYYTGDHYSSFTLLYGDAQ